MQLQFTTDVLQFWTDQLCVGGGKGKQGKGKCYVMIRDFQGPLGRKGQSTASFYALKICCFAIQMWCEKKNLSILISCISAWVTQWEKCICATIFKPQENEHRCYTKHIVLFVPQHRLKSLTQWKL